MTSSIKFLAWAVLSVPLALGGCVSIGIHCGNKYTNFEAWAKIRRPGLGVSGKQAESMAKFKREVCQ